MADNKTIIIDLDNSLYAHAFTDDQQIHQEDLVKAMDIIHCQLQNTGVRELWCVLEPSLPYYRRFW